MKSELQSIYKVTPRQAPKSRTALPIVESKKEATKVINYRLQSAEEIIESYRSVAQKRYGRN